MPDTPLSPPFRDSDALRIVIARLERVADAMTDRRYEKVEADMAEIADWLEWLSNGIAAREAETDVQP